MPRTQVIAIEGAYWKPDERDGINIHAIKSRNNKEH
jgi:hypothetical protein